MTRNEIIERLQALHQRGAPAARAGRVVSYTALFRAVNKNGLQRRPVKARQRQRRQSLIHRHAMHRRDDLRHAPASAEDSGGGVGVDSYCRLC